MKITRTLIGLILVAGVICILLGQYSCAPMAKQNVEFSEEGFLAFDDVMTQFIEVWPYVSGAIDGAYEGRTFNVPSGHLEIKKEIDQLVYSETCSDEGEVGKYCKGKVATLWMSIVSAEIIRWIKEFKPDVLQLIPAALLVL